MITLTTIQSALALGNAGQRLFFPVKLLNLPVDGTHQHVSHMVEFSLTIPVRVEDPIVNHPKLIGNRIKVNAVNHSYTFDDPMLITRILPSYSLDLNRMRLFQHDIVKNNIAFWPTLEEWANILLKHSWREFLFFEEARNIIVREMGKVIRQTGAGIVNLTGGQILAVQVTRRFRTLNYLFSPIAQVLSILLHCNLSFYVI